MKTFLGLTLLFLTLDSPILAQSTNPPFSSLDKRVREERGGWAGNKEGFSKIFRAERARLGDSFESALIAYIGTDIDKHYWVSSFLVSATYLQGDKPLPHLALLIKQQALSLLRNKTDKDSLGDTLTLCVTAAILAESLGLHGLADGYKRDAERILAKSSDFEAWFPGLDAYDRCLYTIVGTKRDRNQDAPPCKKEDAASSNVPRILRVARGVLETRATSKPEPVLPDEARQKGVSGEVIVEVLIDESGKVQSARALEGHPLLQKAAVDAAYQARFSVTRLQGQPIKVAGVLTYSFKK